jgi:hypothetical protein
MFHTTGVGVFFQFAHKNIALVHAVQSRRSGLPVTLKIWFFVEDSELICEATFFHPKMLYLACLDYLK